MLLGIFYSANSLKQQSTGGHVLHSQHIILILSQPVFVLTPYCCDRSREYQCYSLSFNTYTSYCDKYIYYLGLYHIKIRAIISRSQCCHLLKSCFSIFILTSILISDIKQLLPSMDVNIQIC